MTLKRYFTINEELGNIQVGYLQTGDKTYTIYLQDIKNASPKQLHLTREEAQDLIITLQKVMNMVDEEQTK